MYSESANILKKHENVRTHCKQARVKSVVPLIILSSWEIALYLKLGGVS
jgi:hypothetical protein